MKRFFCFALIFSRIVFFATSLESIPYRAEENLHAKDEPHLEKTQQVNESTPPTINDNSLNKTEQVSEIENHPSKNENHISENENENHPIENENANHPLEKILQASEAPFSVPYKNLEIPGGDHRLVEKFREYYLRPQSVSWLSQVLEDAESYRLYVRRLLIERNMPSFLEYLPVVESSYTTRARSKSGALGMWQFMANSTKPFLIRNDFVDERYDPWRSTEAALSKLQENYNMFKDWALAIAAYNCGAGALSRTMKKNPGKDFWGLADANQLSEQTTNYVPKLLAIADVATNSEYYNVDIPSASDELGEPINPRAGFFDYAEAKGSVSLRRVAQEMRIDESLLFSLNAALIKGITPPNQKWKIRVPEGMAESAKDALAIITPYTFQTKYIVQKGDSLWGISRKYKISVASICEVNNISEKQVLQIGKILYIPFE